MISSLIQLPLSVPLPQRDEEQEAPLPIMGITPRDIVIYLAYY